MTHEFKPPLLHEIKMAQHQGEHCKVFLSDLEHLADEAARHILTHPHATPDYLRSCLHGWFVQAQGMVIPELQNKSTAQNEP
jgi:hypothetical protein